MGCGGGCERFVVTIHTFFLISINFRRGGFISFLHLWRCFLGVLTSVALKGTIALRRSKLSRAREFNLWISKQLK